MGRHGYGDYGGDYDDTAQARYIAHCGAVKKAMEGFRGQAFLQELRRVLDAMPKKELIRGELQDGDSVCALGAIGRARGTSLFPVRELIAEAKADYGEFWEHDADLGYINAKLAELLDITPTLASEIMYANDGDGLPLRNPDDEPPDVRWWRMRRWVENHILPENR